MFSPNYACDVTQKIRKNNKMKNQIDMVSSHCVRESDKWYWKQSLVTNLSCGGEQTTNITGMKCTMKADVIIVE